MVKIIYIFIAIAIIAGVFSTFISSKDQEQIFKEDEVVACTAEAMLCPDGSYVGRSGPNCEFAACPAVNDNPNKEQNRFEDKADLIRVTSLIPNEVIKSPMIINGEARGGWFFEASFPVSLVNWDGLIVADGVAEAQGDWMTSEFVPFTANLEFVNPYQVGDPDFMKKGTLILQKDNPSGLPENDDALEIPINFAQ